MVSNKPLSIAAVAVLFMVRAAVCQPADYDRLLELNRSLMELEAVHGELTPSDVSRERLSSNGAEVESIRRELLEMQADEWPVSQKTDYLLVLSRANELAFQYRVFRPWFRDPGFYLDHIRTVPHVELPLPGRDLEVLGAKLESVPIFLDQARQNLTLEACGTLADLALLHLDRYDGVGQGEPLRPAPPPGVGGWYEELAKLLPQHHPQLQGEAEKALEAVLGFRDWLKDRRGSMTASCRIGLAQYDWFLKHVRLMPFSSEDVRRLGQREFDRSLTFLKIEQNKNRLLPELMIATTKNEYEARVRTAENHIRTFIKEHRLLSIPEGIGPLATDAFWRAGMKRHFWEELQYRDAHNNHIHASIPGHRFDMLVAAKNPDPIRCTIRDSGRIEGWAFYVEEMLLQAGLLDKEPRARELFYIAQVARAVRIPTELGIQEDQLTFDDAVSFMIDRVPFMEENLARYDLEIYLRNPTYGMNYVMGRVQLEQLLAERALQLGNAFDLGEFHDQFLSYGLIPISMIRWEMTGKDDEARMLWEELRR